MNDAAQALSFGHAAAAYDRVRPSYPASAVGWGARHRTPYLVDLGAGTGLSCSYYLVAGPQRRADLETRVRIITDTLPAEFELPHVTVNRATRDS